MKKVIFIYLITLLAGHAGYSQESWMFKGYLKGMSIMQTVGDNGEMAIENILHNRIDLSWYATERLTLTAGLRNRIIAGNNVSLIPDYSDYVSRDPGYLDLSWVWADRTSWVGVSQLDRLMIDYTAGKFQVTLGRQRINWGSRSRMCAIILIF